MRRCIPRIPRNENFIFPISGNGYAFPGMDSLLTSSIAFTMPVSTALYGVTAHNAKSLDRYGLHIETFGIFLSVEFLQAKVFF